MPGPMSSENPRAFEDVEPDCLDPHGIAARGRFLLNRAIGSRNLVAFLGAGSSMAYGRISWTDLAVTHARTLEDFHRPKLENNDGKDAPSGTQGLRSLVDLCQHVRRKLEKGEGDQRLLLMLCEQVWTLTEADDIEKLATTRFGLDKAFVAGAKRGRTVDFAVSCFQEAIKQETVDERAHVRRILAGNLPMDGNPLVVLTELDVYELSAGRSEDWDTVFEKTWERPVFDRTTLRRDRHHTAFFTPATLGRIADALREHRGSLSGDDADGPRLDVALEILRTMADTAKMSGVVKPTLYFLLSPVLDLARLAGSMERVARAIVAVPPEFARTRTRFIDPADDPIDLLVRGLGIRRFATTNYDLELERYFDDRGYSALGEREAQSAHAAYERFGALGDRARDMTLDGDGAVELVDFALTGHSYAMEVAHLHGRATRDSRILVTERDYRDIYIQNGGSAEAYRQGLSILLGGNPILFIGVGLSEADLLRPLREFMALDPDGKRPVFALMPAWAAAEEDRNAEVLAEWSRNGIHVLHYGVGDPGGTALPQSLAQAKAILARPGAKPGDDGPGPRGREHPLLRILRAVAAILAPGNLPPSAVGTTTDAWTRISADAAKRVESALLTEAVTAALARLDQDWDDWRTRWTALPDDRGQHLSYAGPTGAFIGDDAEKNPTRTWIRHYARVEQNGAEVDPPPASFLVKALGMRCASKTPRRRLFVLSGEVGAGKGRIFAGLIGHVSSDAGKSLGYRAHLFAGFSFSCEVASVWDSLIDFILWPDDFGLLKREEFQGRELPHGGRVRPYRLLTRIERLEAALAQASRRHAVGDRLLVTFNAFDMLFHGNGDAKNSEIHRIVELLFGAKGAAAPIDFVILVRSSRCPICLRPEAARPEPKPEPKPGPVSRRYAALALGLSFKTIEVPVEGSESIRLGPIAENLHVDLVNRPAPPVGADGALVPTRQRYMEFLRNQIEANCPSKEDPAWRAFERHESRAVSDDDQLASVLDFWARKAAELDCTTPAGDPVLHEAILRHLAVISIPVQGTVLARCPRILRIVADHHHGKPIEAFITGALKFLVERAGLVLEIDTKFSESNEKKVTAPGAEEPEPSKGCRYQVHRIVQHHVYRRLGCQVSEPVESMYFTPTLFASQAKNLPQLHPDSYLFLYELVDALSGYPAPGSRNLSTAAKPGDRTDRSASLRAALGVVRMLLSLGVVSRFGDPSALPVPAVAGDGYLEHHRHALQWMIAAAVSLSQPKGGRGGTAPNWSDHDVPPFYIDETVWLLNEVGVFALAQGRCQDADIFLGRALKANERAEGVPGGAMHRRLLLNRGLCAIDRGRLAMAHALFTEVEHATGEERLLLALAQGYLGYVEHLRGRFEQADGRYRSALDDLEQLGHLRAISQLRRQRADMLRKTGRIAAARRELESAVQAAEAGGFSDFLHYARVSKARIDFADGAGLSELLPPLDKAEAYAARMDSPRLKVDVLRMRAEIFLAQGETRLPADLTREALRLSNLNDLVLRRIANTELLSRIYRQQGNSEGAERLQASAWRAARACGYHLNTGNRDPRAQDVTTARDVSER